MLSDSWGCKQRRATQEHRAKSTDDAIGLIETATSFRRTQPTQKNAVSSRSHAICRVRVERNTANTDADRLLYLVDLAGSEAARDVATQTAERMKEAREINASLSVLKDCIRNKAESDALDNVALTASKSDKMKMKKPHVPFRQSALTRVLKHVFDPAGARNCKTVVIACVNPSIADVGASRNTLRYAEMLRVLVPKAKDAGYKSDSGTPPILSAVLAPVETGTQLLRLPASDFEARCLITRGSTIEQAKSLHLRLWELHIDSQRNSRQDDGSCVEPRISAGAGESKVTQRLSSRELDSKVSMLPFKERIRPGMVVSWTPQHDFPMGTPGKMNLAMSGMKCYLCALILPSTTVESYVVSIWQQVVIEVGAMNAEVWLEYNPATRLYYTAI
ncbi:kinesin motor domain-containing protein [Diaporthe sp. PMI_573]|nr:kinesin motor domain-containing protein [Diaporthaceae sp. PMI_573]